MGWKFEKDLLVSDWNYARRNIYDPELIDMESELFEGGDFCYDRANYWYKIEKPRLIEKLPTNSLFPYWWEDADHIVRSNKWYRVVISFKSVKGAIRSDDGLDGDVMPDSIPDEHFEKPVWWWIEEKT